MPEHRFGGSHSQSADSVWDFDLFHESFSQNLPEAGKDRKCVEYTQLGLSFHLRLFSELLEAILLLKSVNLSSFSSLAMRSHRENIWAVGQLRKTALYKRSLRQPQIE